MIRLLLAGTAALGMMTSAAMAQSSRYSSGQTTTDETTTITPAQAPWTFKGTTTTGRGATADGVQSATSASTSTDTSGNGMQTTITNTTYPLSKMVMTTKKETTIANGVATEVTTITTTYPPYDPRPPVVMTGTRSYVVGAK
jgi:type IV secretory pathway TrbL component